MTKIISEANREQVELLQAYATDNLWREFEASTDRVEAQKLAEKAELMGLYRVSEEILQAQKDSEETAKEKEDTYKSLVGWDNLYIRLGELCKPLT